MIHAGPLRAGSRGGIVVGAEDFTRTPTDIPAITQPITLSMQVPLPPYCAYSHTPSWLEKEVTKQMKSAKVTLRADWGTKPRESMRRRREDGDLDSWWTATLIPKGSR
jgi:hypothetical protein